MTESEFSLAGSPTADEHLCKLMVDTHGVRFDGRVWDAFDDEIASRMAGATTVADLGCGPGLFLFDVSQRMPGARLVGVDRSATMLEFARSMTFSDNAVPQQLVCHDLSHGIPEVVAAADVIAMNFFLHQIEQPVNFLKDVRSRLSARGVIWLYDWARKPLSEYLEFWKVDESLPSPGDEGSIYRLFPVHNKFTLEDWHFVFAQAGLAIVHEQPRARGQHWLIILTPSPGVQPTP